ncbi:hypothetical protein [Haloglycomyces albus]|uniref:hypothetical protein n=1 Tax=Haloglycomyces albus TaxID=526067 RepID=UPI00046D828A|nr:hypothetical protein [Haloglycomyces albus]
MAKALYGHLEKAPNKRLADEVIQLRARVRSLETELAELRSKDEVSTSEEEELARVPEPVLS